MNFGDRARENFLGGCTCAQAVVKAFEEQLCLSEQSLSLLSALSRPFGGGMGRLRLTCGCVSGGVMVLGAFFPDLQKSELYALVQEYARRFKQKNGSVICGELLTGAGIAADTSVQAEPRTAEYYRKRPCPDLVYDGAQILFGLLSEKGVLGD